MPVSLRAFPWLGSEGLGSAKPRRVSGSHNEGLSAQWSGNAVRLQAIKDVEAYVPPAVSFDAGEEPGAIFGQNVFSLSVMQKRLPKNVYQSVLATIEKSAPLDPAVRRRRRLRDEGLGAGEGRDPLRARLLPADRPHRGEARQLPRARSATVRRWRRSRARP